MNTPILSICIMSYNRPSELMRCIESIPENTNKIEIIIRDDASPKIDVIKKACSQLKRSDLKLVSAEHNGGFDKNFFEVLKLATGEFKLLCTDDDYFESDGLLKLVDYLERCDASVVLCPYFEVKQNRIMRKSLRNSRDKICKNFTGHQIFDLILISGLVFRSATIPEYKLEIVDGSVYSQVFLALICGYLSGFSYFDEVVVICAEDGENGFSNSDDPKKQDRKHFLSNLGFHYGLINAVNAADSFLFMNGEITKKFTLEYNLRSSTGLMIASRYGRRAVIEYWQNMMSLPIKIKISSYVFFILVVLLGHGCSKKLHSIGRNLMHIVRA